MVVTCSRSGLQLPAQGSLEGLSLFEVCLLRDTPSLTAPRLVSRVSDYTSCKWECWQLLSPGASILISLFMDPEGLVQPDFFSGI